jgi:hypothetical protein
MQVREDSEQYGLRSMGREPDLIAFKNMRVLNIFSKYSLKIT